MYCLTCGKDITGKNHFKTKGHLENLQLQGGRINYTGSLDLSYHNRKQQEKKDYNDVRTLDQFNTRLRDRSLDYHTPMTQQDLAYFNKLISEVSNPEQQDQMERQLEAAQARMAALEKQEEDNTGFKGFFKGLSKGMKAVGSVLSVIPNPIARNVGMVASTAGEAGEALTGSGLTLHKVVAYNHLTPEEATALAKRTSGTRKRKVNLTTKGNYYIYRHTPKTKFVKGSWKRHPVQGGYAVFGRLA